jgi:hypothetical protein
VPNYEIEYLFHNYNTTTAIKNDCINAKIIGIFQKRKRDNHLNQNNRIWRIINQIKGNLSQFILS